MELVASVCKVCLSSKDPNQPFAYCCLGKARTKSPGDILPEGVVLAGNYRIGRLLGGFGATFLALDPDIDRRVAIEGILPRQMKSRARKTRRVVPGHN